MFLVHHVFWCCAIGEYRERGCRGQGGQVKVRLDWKGVSGSVYSSEKLGGSDMMHRRSMEIR